MTYDLREMGGEAIQARLDQTGSTPFDVESQRSRTFDLVLAIHLKMATSWGAADGEFLVYIEDVTGHRMAQTRISVPRP